MMPVDYPEINIYWKNVKSQEEGFNRCYKKLVYGQLEKIGDIIVGIAEVSNMRRVVPIAVADDAFEEGGFYLSAFTLITDSYLPVIFLESLYYNEMQRIPVLKTNIYHELGHGVLGHVSRKNPLHVIHEGRQKAMNIHEVFYQEKEADLFACHYVGKEKMLDHLKNVRKVALKKAAQRDFNRNALPKILEEVDQRIKLIEDYDFGIEQ